jgi:hypothetical protein
VVQALQNEAIRGKVKISGTSGAGGMKMASGRGWSHLVWLPLIFKKNFLISVLLDLSVLVTT